MIKRGENMKIHGMKRSNNIQKSSAVLFAAALIGILAVVPAAGATVTNITPSEDTFSYIFEPDTNMGGNTEVSVWNYYGRQSDYAYIKFANISGTGSPNIPSNSNINSATMWLYTRAGESQTITFYTPSASWTESSLTWNNQPSPVTPYASVAQDGSTAHWTSVDVTNIVRKWNDGTITNNGLVALSDGGGASASTDWRSKENKTNKPYISVDYTAPPNDITPPATDISLAGSRGNNDWYTSNVQVNLIATDDEGGSGVKMTEYSFDGTNWIQYTGQFTMTDEGTTTVYYRSTDNAGNIESIKTQAVKIDKTPPTITGIPFVSKFSDDFNDNDISDWTKSTNGNADVIADSGRMRLRVYKCSDADAYKDLGFVSGEITVDFDWATSGDGWYEYPGWKLIVDGVTVVDDNVPVTQWYGTNSGHITKTVNVIGSVQLAYRLRQSQYCSYGDHGNTYYWVDNVVVNTVVNANNWYNTDVVVKFTASDDLSGIDTVTPDTIISTEGAAQSVTGTAVDKAGNSASTPVSGINIDKTPPTTTIMPSGSAGTNGWYVSDVQVTLTAADNEGGSGVKNIEYSLDGTNWNQYIVPFTTTNEGLNTVYYHSTDSAGNVELTKNQTIKIDKTPPNIDGAPTTSPNANGWYKSDVLVHFTASDAMSGVGSVTPDTTLSAEGVSQSVTGTAMDKAGNSNSATVSGINIDKTSPQITINTPASGGMYLLNQALSADWSVADSLSGIASATGTLPSGATIDTGTVGTKTFTVTATDIASNTATQTSSYTIAYNFLGILPPIRTDGSSIFNLGRTVPVKFRIADANGNYVSTATATLTYQLITNDILGTVEEAVSTSAASEGNTFRNSTDNHYIFNLGTSGMSTGTYQLNINLDDGTVHTVRISLR